MRTVRIALALLMLLLGLCASPQGQRTDVFVGSRDQPDIAYSTANTDDPVADLNDKMAGGTVSLAFDASVGYLRTVLRALNIPEESQSLVFSQTSAQADLIGFRDPRAVYFNDNAAVGWVRGADHLEVIAQDPRQGAVFYTLPQKAVAAPRFVRQLDACLSCHLTWDTLGVPGWTVLSTFQMSDDPNAYATGGVMDHRTPLEDRWGGWYVTGKPGGVRHRGNVPIVVKASELEGPPKPAPQLDSVTNQFDTRGFLNPHSDVVALMLLEHQAHMSNLITRLGWEARATVPSGANSGPTGGSRGRIDDRRSRVQDAVGQFVDYLLFVDEAPLKGPIIGGSGFAERFSSGGPRDKLGRSLRQLDLDRRLFRYPCSYMIYTPAFDALPPLASDAVYRRLWAILSGEDKDARYARLSRSDRQAILEILRETKKQLPEYFGTAVRQ